MGGDHRILAGAGKRGSRLSVLAALALLCGAAHSAPKMRLAEVESIDPQSYRADLMLDPAKNTFSGSIVIRMNIQQPLDTLWLNQKLIHIKSARLAAAGKTQSGEVVPGGDEFVGLKFPSVLPTGIATLTIEYSGAVNEKTTAGIFRQEEGGNWYLITQFEPTDARAAFPCFDEPAYKTPWQVTLRVPENEATISNTPIASETRKGGVKTVVFKETKPLPSYLVAFAVGPFDFVPAGTAGRNKVPVRIVVPKGRANEATYAAEVTATILTKLEDYFGIPYPYEKTDQLAIPNSSGFGAMENPGMVTYDQNILLADPKVDRIGRQRGYASTAAHELSHQWFGDLVTTAWWDDIWLNEAFATWSERRLLAEWKPEWNSRVADVADKLRAEDDDSLISARKIRQEILANDDIINAFDNITYQKGATVIGMFENWMGPAEFRKGVQSYLTHYAYQATTAAQFLDSLSTSSKKNVTAAFSTFLDQAGVPLVSVGLDCHGDEATLHLTQQRFLPLGSKGSADQTWQIPLCVRYGTGASGHSQCTLMTEGSATLALTEAKGCPAWVQGNDRAIGYYRVDYEGSLLAALTNGDVQARLPATERADLMGNAAALVKGGKLAAADSLSLVNTFHDDPERYVADAAMTLALAPLGSLVPDDLEPNFQRFLLGNFQARAHALGWTATPGETDDTRLLRPRLVRPVATWGNDREFAAQGQALADKWLADHGAVDPNMLDAVLGTAAFYGDKALFDRFLTELKKTEDKQTRQALLRAMLAFRDPKAIEAGMGAVVDGEVPFIEGARLLFNGQQEAATRKLAFEFLKAHWDQVVKSMPTGGGFDFGSVLPRVGSSYCDVASRDELKTYFEPRVDKFVGAPRTLAQVLEEIDLCIANKAAQGPSVAAFLEHY
jgi:alanyl aminopeptidase